MLQLRPNCEACNKDLPPNATDACICSYECTFCANCVSGLLNNVCPNCGGGFVPRPIRPHNEYRPGVSLTLHPSSLERVKTQYSDSEIRQFVDSIKHISPEQR